MKKTILLSASMIIIIMALTSCVSYNQENDTAVNYATTSSTQAKIVTSVIEKETHSASITSEIITELIPNVELNNQTSPFSLKDISSFSKVPYCEVNDNKPFFNNDEITTQSYEYYPELDNLGRCGTCIACISIDMMPTTEREGIGMIKPSGWQLSKYDFVDGKYLFNRCHLIGYQLTGENANLSNLITGTRYMNTQGMLPFENMTANYIKSTGNHVMYRVTPFFEGDNLVATGVLMEGYSVEDKGQGIRFNVFCYNAQPGVVIDYANGENHLDENSDVIVDAFREDENTPHDVDSGTIALEDKQSQTYILNKNTKKIHYPWCSSVEDMAEHNKQEFTGAINEIISQGYSPCKRCNPS